MAFGPLGSGRVLPVSQLPFCQPQLPTVETYVTVDELAVTRARNEI